MKSGPSRTWRIVLWGSSLPALLAASFLYYPFVFDGPVLCPMPLVLGMPCPGCGLTRAFCCMSHAEFARAFEFNAIWPFVLGYFAFLWIYKIVEASKGEPPNLPAHRIGAVAILIVLGFWVVRLGFFFANGGLAVMARDNLVSRLIRLFS